MPPGVTLTPASRSGARASSSARSRSGADRASRRRRRPIRSGDLVAHRGSLPAAAASARLSVDLAPRDVTFPQILSDDDRPSTALAAVRAGNAPGRRLPTPLPTQPPPATDRLPVVPLPAQAVLEASPIVTHPRDALTKAASDAAQINGALVQRDVARRVTTAATSSRCPASGRRARRRRSPISSARAATRRTSSRPTCPTAAPGSACASGRSGRSTPPRRTARASRSESTWCRSSCRRRPSPSDKRSSASASQSNA